MLQGGVLSPGVVEAFDVREGRRSRHLTARPRVAVDQLPLQGRDKRFALHMYLRTGAAPLTAPTVLKR
jgi:hypothetical protein